MDVDAAIEIAWKRLQRFEVATPNADWLELEFDKNPENNRAWILATITGTAAFDWESVELGGNTIAFLDHLGAVLAEDSNLNVEVSVQNQMGESASIPFADWKLAQQRAQVVAESLNRRWKIQPDRIKMNSTNLRQKAVHLKLTIFQFVGSG